MNWVIVYSAGGGNKAKFFIYPENVKHFIQFLKDLDISFNLYEYDGEHFVPITEDQI